jgi:hypothetical protein
MSGLQSLAVNNSRRLLPFFTCGDVFLVEFVFAGRYTRCLRSCGHCSTLKNRYHPLPVQLLLRAGTAWVKWVPVNCVVYAPWRAALICDFFVSPAALPSLVVSILNTVLCAEIPCVYGHYVIADVQRKAHSKVKNSLPLYY